MVYIPSEAEVCLTVKASLGYVAKKGYNVRPLSETTSTTKTKFKQKPESMFCPHSTLGLTEQHTPVKLLALPAVSYHCSSPLK